MFYQIEKLKNKYKLKQRSFLALFVFSIFYISCIGLDRKQESLLPVCNSISKNIQCNASLSLPADSIFIKNLSQGFSYEYLYALKDGKIWTKPNEKNTGIKGDWELFNKTGIPGGKDAASFKKEDCIAQFSTEGTMITAVSNRGRFYIWQPTLKAKTTWADETGAPIEDALYLPKTEPGAFH